MILKKILSATMAALMGLTLMSGCSDEGVSEAEKESAKEDVKSMSEITATEIATEMKIGWNVGNSLDAMGADMGSETCWGNPKITEDLIKAAKNAGFNTIRVPVTWMGHFDESNYTIREDWMNRVDEVVNYVLNNDMYCIINIHHDGSDTTSSWLTPEPANADEMVNCFTTLWTQIAKKFENYDEKLLFAGMNEFHRGYDQPKDEYLALTDRLNQAFVDTVRNGGGNNKDRILIVQSYNTNADYLINNLVLPNDTAENKLMVECHYYDPWTFAGEGRNSWGVGGRTNDRWGQEDWVDDKFSQLKAKFVDNGIPVIIGEYGATINKAGYSDTRRYYVEYVTRAAHKNGIVPIWWDNGYDGLDGEAFALFDRNNGNAVLHQDIIDAMKRATSGEDYEITLPVYPTA